MNLDTLSSLAGQQVAVRDLVELNKALRASGNQLAKAASAVGGGYSPTTGAAAGLTSVGSNELVPLVPQSIQNTLDTASYTDAAITLWKRIAKVPVSSVIHESAVVNAYGPEALDPWIGEGGGGGDFSVSHGDYERKIVSIKYMASKREITDVATMVGMIGYNGVTRGALAQATMDGTRELMGKLERSLFSADSDLTSLAFDGLYKQILDTSFATTGVWSAGRTSTRTDKAGAAITVQDLVETVYEMSASPRYSAPNVALVEPRVFAGLVNLASAFGRFDQPAAARSQILFGADGLQIAGPTGMVPVVACPLLTPPLDPPAAAAGTAPTAYGGSGITIAAFTDANGFTAATAGTYTYKVVAVGENGHDVGTDTAATAVTAGQSIRITIDDSTKHGTDLRYYRVYRHSGDGTFKFLFNYPTHTGASSDTLVVDDNSHRPNTAPVYLLQLTPDVLYWCQLLDFLRRPLAQVATTVPFLLMLFGALHVKVPTKCHVIDNVALTV